MRDICDFVREFERHRSEALALATLVQTRGSIIAGLVRACASPATEKQSGR